jgi:hypothetical protein
MDWQRDRRVPWRLKWTSGGRSEMRRPGLEGIRRAGGACEFSGGASEEGRIGFGVWCCEHGGGLRLDSLSVRMGIGIAIAGGGWVGHRPAEPRSLALLCGIGMGLPRDVADRWGPRFWLGILFPWVVTFLVRDVTTAPLSV